MTYVTPMQCYMHIAHVLLPMCYSWHIITKHCRHSYSALNSSLICTVYCILFPITVQYSALSSITEQSPLLQCNVPKDSARLTIYYSALSTIAVQCILLQCNVLITLQCHPIFLLFVVFGYSFLHSTVF